MLANKRILITGVTGKAVLPIARALAVDNEVFGLARFADEASLEQVRAAGIRPCRADLDVGDLSEVPADVDHVLHFAWMRASLAELERAIRVNVVGAGLILQHCRSAQSALVVSSQGIYSAHPDPLHLYAENDPIGRGSSAYAQTSPATKLGLEAVARFCAQAFDLPVTIARLNTVIGPRKAYFAALFDAVREGREIVLPGEPNCHSPIHTEDMIAQIEPLLAAASVPATVVNWCGDDVVTTQQTLARTGELLGIPARIKVVSDPTIPAGNPNDTVRRMALTGPCLVPFWQGFEAMAGEIMAETKA